jgi:hypothetical protein
MGEFFHREYKAERKPEQVLLAKYITAEKLRDKKHGGLQKLTEHELE